MQLCSIRRNSRVIKKQLIFKGVSEVVGVEDLGLLALVDIEGERQITITCDGEMLRQFSWRIHHLPVVGRLLPEVLWQALSSHVGENAFEILITDIIDGQYRAILRNIATGDTVSVRASDAILLAYISKLPIYIEEQLFAMQSVPYRENSRGMAMPLNALSREMLDNALDSAIKSENYEMASYIRDELKRREKSINDGIMPSQK